MNASRLPNKVLMCLGRDPALTHMVRRVRQCRSIDDIVVATSDSPLDDEIELWAKREGVPCFRGSENDVLDRVLRAQQSMDSEIVVELCGDCPLIEAAVIDAAVNCFFETSADVVTTARKPSFPDGIDVEVFALSSLQWVAKNVKDPHVREHVSSYFYQNSDRYRLVDLEAPTEWRSPDIRLLLDYPEDLLFLQRVFDHFLGNGVVHPNLGEVLKLIQRDSQFQSLHERCVQRAGL